MHLTLTPWVIRSHGTGTGCCSCTAGNWCLNLGSPADLTKHNLSLPQCSLRKQVLWAICFPWDERSIYYPILLKRLPVSLRVIVSFWNFRQVGKCLLSWTFFLLKNVVSSLLWYILPKTFSSPWTHLVPEENKGWVLEELWGLMPALLTWQVRTDSYGSSSYQKRLQQNIHICESIRAQVFKEKYFENSHWLLARTANPDFSVLYRKKAKINNIKPGH